MALIRFTKEGFEKLKKDYEELKAERPDAVEHLKKARDMGDLSENGYYKASKAKLASIDGRLWKMSMDIKHALVIEDSKNSGIDIGKTVTLANDKREMTYKVVGDLEANPSEGKISLLSPIGKAIAGKQLGDEIKITTPSGEVAYKIIKLS